MLSVLHIFYHFFRYHNLIFCLTIIEFIFNWCKLVLHCSLKIINNLKYYNANCHRIRKCCCLLKQEDMPLEVLVHAVMLLMQLYYDNDVGEDEALQILCDLLSELAALLN